MVITNDTVKNLVEFTNQNDNFFLGSNADLSIVGGSLLGHNHYQGGEDILPIMNAKILQSFTFQEAIIDVLD
jgi:UDPglucose--hexose-1-phosphate uridylyltransferase